MAHSQSLDRSTSPSTANAQARFTALLAVLLCEALLALRMIDTRSLIGHDLWWVEPLRSLSHNVPWGACIVAAVGLLGAGRWRAAFGRLFEHEHDREHPFERGARARAAVAHVLWAGVFTALSQLVLAGGSTLPLLDAVLPLLWGAAGILALCGALLATAPARAWRAAGAPLVDALAGGAVIGSTLFWLGFWIDGNYFLWGPLADVTLRASAAMVGLYTDGVYLEESTRILGTESFRVIVTKYCSGLEGLALFGLFFGTFLVLARRRLRLSRALWLMPAGLVLVWGFNAARIAALIALGHFVDPQLAVDAFHTHAGWPPLIAVALGCVWIATRVPAFRPRSIALAGGEAAPTAGVASPTSSTSSSPSPNTVAALAPSPVATRRDPATTAYLVPLLAVVGTGLVAGAFLDEGATSAPARVAVAALVLACLRGALPRIGGLRGFFDGARQLHVWLLAAACLGLWMAVDPAQGAGGAPPAWLDGASLLARSGFWIAAALGYAVVTPLVEELAFRGFVQRRLVSADFERVSYRRPAPLAVFGSALAFGLLHTSIVGGVLAGVLFSLAAARRGRLGDAVWAHALVNGALAVIAATTGDWGWWF
ncbi:Transmembrane exosortase (Exosortase_EpsH) [Planctomycetes bacterium Pla163]|uniref:Transmembrane exosortase (Exosortase_EpsH) n=1 Tax=Rohdeia mirabilis TaxID=2528008 RepID=A0A518D3G3_9BACT|nr:Transmembrane exosortase (Exosortase_EpsH) [Planctomycetes bacterium Pla163]